MRSPLKVIRTGGGLQEVIQDGLERARDRRFGIRCEHPAAERQERAMMRGLLSRDHRSGRRYPASIWAWRICRERGRGAASRTRWAAPVGLACRVVEGGGAIPHGVDGACAVDAAAVLVGVGDRDRIVGIGVVGPAVVLQLHVADAGGFRWVSVPGAAVDLRCRRRSRRICAAGCRSGGTRCGRGRRWWSAPAASAKQLVRLGGERRRAGAGRHSAMRADRLARRRR